MFVFRYVWIPTSVSLFILFNHRSCVRNELDESTVEAYLDSRSDLSKLRYVLILI